MTRLPMLKGCPFCGCDASTREADGPTWIECDMCGARGDDFGWADNAITAWNTRATDPAKLEMLDVIAALVECFIKRGPWDEPLGSSEQAPSINAAVAILAKLQDDAALTGVGR